MYKYTYVHVYIFKYCIDRTDTCTYILVSPSQGSPRMFTPYISEKCGDTLVIYIYIYYICMYTYIYIDIHVVYIYIYKLYIYTYTCM